MSAYPKAVAEGWHPVATLKALRKGKPLARRLMGKPVVVFQSADGPAVLLDRCPHRNMALSRGRVREGAIECPYHGWRFAQDGRCVLTPGAEEPARHGATPLPVIERAGIIWTTLAERPNAGPTLPHPIEADGFDSFWWPIKPTRARLLDAVENLLDPAHPHFLHPGIVRSGTARNPVEATVRVAHDYAEARYIENTQAQALMPRVMEGKRVASIGRFFPPSTGQVAFENTKGLKLSITVFFVPEADELVRPLAHLATQSGVIPPIFKEIMLRAFDMVILAQDQLALRRQAEDIAAFGAPKYAVGPLDVLFPAIHALANGETPAPSERTLRMML
ncbi:Rieske 2Fe-2S domain-containing protein [Terricaulis sp.]|uniref:Rieske 2Fe-2S domain-containing protein n=1 Tax=Terricaulis sp. TaxID=2768686 RepID=UPI0037832CED